MASCEISRFGTFVGAAIGEDARQLRRDRHTGGKQLVHDVRTDPGWPEDAGHDAVLVRTVRLVEEDFLHRDGVAFHAGDLRDAGHLALAVAHARKLHDQVDRGSGLLADGPHRQVDAGHQYHRFQPGQRVAGGVGVQGGQRAVVTGVHRLQHVERLSGTALADHDAVGAHPESVDDELADADLVLAVEVGRA